MNAPRVSGPSAQVLVCDVKERLVRHAESGCRIEVAGVRVKQGGTTRGKPPPFYCAGRWLTSGRQITDLLRLVRKGEFEPPRYCYRQPLKLVRLPVPPLPQVERTYYFGVVGCCCGTGADGGAGAGA